MMIPPINHFSDKTDPIFPEKTVLIIGLGHFGQRAARILSARPELSLVLIDQDQGRINRIQGGSFTKITTDGVRFLAEHADQIHPANIIVPALPCHLAFEWLSVYLKRGLPSCSVKKLPLPKGLHTTLPHTWDGSDGSLLISYADFICPDDCSEPAEACTVTGERRSQPLHALLAEVNAPGSQNHVIASRQLAPGLGGYAFSELKRLFDCVIQAPKTNWLISTACRCHGVMTAMEVT